MRKFNINTMDFMLNNHTCPNCGLNLSKLNKYKIIIKSINNKKDSRCFTIYSEEKTLNMISQYFKNIVDEKLILNLQNKIPFSNLKTKKNTHRILVQLLNEETNKQKVKCISFKAQQYTSKEIFDAIMKIIYQER
jgi:hypothetical protein